MHNSYFSYSFHHSRALQCSITAEYCYLRFINLQFSGCNVLAVSNRVWLPAKIRISSQNKSWKEPTCLCWFWFIKRLQIQIDIFSSIFDFHQPWNGNCEHFDKQLKGLSGFATASVCIFFVFFPLFKIITVLQCLVNYHGCCWYALGTAFLHSPVREMHWSWKHTRMKVLHNKDSPLLHCYQYK